MIRVDPHIIIGGIWLTRATRKASRCPGSPSWASEEVRVLLGQGCRLFKEQDNSIHEQTLVLLPPAEAQPPTPTFPDRRPLGWLAQMRAGSQNTD